MQGERTEFKMQDPGYRMQEKHRAWSIGQREKNGCRIQDAKRGCKIQDAGFRIQVPGFRIQDVKAGAKIQDSGCREER